MTESQFSSIVFQNGPEGRSIYETPLASDDQDTGNTERACADAETLKPTLGHALKATLEPTLKHAMELRLEPTLKLRMERGNLGWNVETYAETLKPTLGS